jgi:hypothetical protein
LFNFIGVAIAIAYGAAIFSFWIFFSRFSAVMRFWRFIWQRQWRRAQPGRFKESGVTERLPLDEPALERIKRLFAERVITHISKSDKGAQINIAGVDPQAASRLESLEKLLGFLPAGRRSTSHHNEVTLRYVRGDALSG